MALLDRLAQAQQIIGGYQNQLNYAREYQDQMRLAERDYRDSMRFAEAAEGRARSEEERARAAEERRMAAEDRVAQLFPTQKAMAELELASAGLGFESAMRQLEAYDANQRAAGEVRSLMGKIYRQVGNMATAPEKITAKEFTGIRNEIVDLLESNAAAAPYLASAVGMLSSIENRAMTTASPAYKSFGDRVGSLRRGLWGGPSIYDPKLGWFKKQEMPSMGDRWEMIKWAFTSPEERGKVEEGAFQTSTLGQMLTMGDPLIYSAMQQEGN
jgi:hypothetical protein